MGVNKFWEPPPAHLILPVREVHVWRASLDVPDSYVQSLERTLSTEELKRAGRFYFEAHRRDFTIGRGLLRSILGLYLDVAPDRVSFFYNAYGKPLLRDEVIHFNLSHSGRMVIYGISCGRKIGVDIERTRTDFDCEQLAEKFLSDRECAMLQTLPHELRHHGFFNCWTRKEAFIKAIGQGVSFPLKQFDVSLLPGEPACILSIRGDVHASARWHLEDLDVEGGYIAAYAIEGRISQLRCWQWMER